MNQAAWLGFPLLMVAALDLLLGFLLLKPGHRHRASLSAALLAFIFAIHSLIGAVVYLRAWLGLDYEIYYRAAWSGWLVIPAGYQVVYALRNGQLAQPRVVPILLYGFWLLVLLASLFTDWVEQGARTLVPYVDRSAPLEQPLRLLGGVLLVWITILAIRVRQQTVGLRRLKLTYFASGLLLTTGSLALALSFAQLGGGLGLDPALGGIFSLPWVLLTFYAITQHRLFDIRIVFSRLIVVLLLLLLLSGLHLLLFRLSEDWLGPMIAAFAAFWGAFLLYVGLELHPRLQGFVGRLVEARSYDPRQILNESLRAMISILELGELLVYIEGVMGKTLRCRKVHFLVPREDGSYRPYRNSDHEPEECAEPALSGSIVDWLTTEAQIFLLEEQEQQMSPERFAEILGTLAPFEAQVAAPVIFKGQLQAVILLGEKANRDPYFQHDLELLEGMANQSAIALQNAQLYHDAVTDSLTGLFHRRYFRLRLEEEFQRSQRYGRFLSLLMIDVDHFKHVNDRHGHLTGDAVLMQLADIFRENVRAGDLVVRYGGEEFLVLLPETNRDAALVAAERVRGSVAAADFGRAGPITVSIGIGWFDQTAGAATQEILIAMADEACYLAKVAGRNQVICGTPEAPESYRSMERRPSFSRPRLATRRNTLPPVSQ